MQARTILALAVALATQGCVGLTYDIEKELESTRWEPGETTTAEVANATHDADTDALTFDVRDQTTRKSERIDHWEEYRSWDVRYMSLTDHLWKETDDGAALLIATPITLAVDIVLPVASLIVAPFRVAFGASPVEWDTRTPEVKVEQRPWTPLELYDPTTGARAPVVNGTRAGDLALNGFRAAALTAIGPEGQERPLTLPPSVAQVFSEVAAGWDRAREELRIRVPLAASLDQALRAAPDGAWLQLEAGDYQLPSTIYLYGKRLTIAGRGAGATRLHARGLAFSLGAARNEVTLRGLTIQLDGSTVSDAVHTSSGHTRLIGCAITGARFEEVPPPPPAPVKPGEPAPPPPGKSYRGGVGLVGDGDGQTTLRACHIGGNGTAGAMARDLHRLRLLGCTFDGGVLEAISFRGESKDNLVSRCTVRGPGHAVGVFGKTAATVQGSDLAAPGAGILVKGEASLSASDNTVHDCGSGISVEDKGTATLWRNTCRTNGVGILLGTEGTHVSARQNRCLDNRANGISLQGKSSADVEGNTCTGNVTGILVSGEARGTVSGNTLENNDTGLAFQDQGAATARGNKLRNNKSLGLQVSDKSSPQVTGNEIRSNRKGGVMLQGKEGSAPSLSDNDIADNAGNGIQVQAGVKPSIWNNRITGNSGAGIIGQAGSFSAPNNTFTNNGDQRGY